MTNDEGRRTNEERGRDFRFSIFDLGLGGGAMGLCVSKWHAYGHRGCGHKHGTRHGTCAVVGE